MSKENKYLIVIAGPTAVGKTSLSIRLAKQFDAEIISADSRQVFKEMTIGTAKITREEKENIAHHFIDIKHVNEDYSAGQYEREVLDFLDAYYKEKEVAILVGGTGLYLQAVLHGLDNFPEVSDLILDNLETELKVGGLDKLQNELQSKDPPAYANIDIQNPRRLLRALSVIRATGKPFSSFQKHAKQTRKFKAIPIVLNLPREDLYLRINQRVDKMIDAGLEAEVKALIPYKDKRALNTVGYKELFKYFENELTSEDAISKIKQHSRNYAKRQITWFKNRLTAKQFSPFAHEDIVQYLKEEMAS